MILYLCECDDCQVVVFTESDAGSGRCPSCGFLGDATRSTDAGRSGVSKLARLLFGRPTHRPTAVPR